MSNTIDPVELEFLLKNTNFKAEAEKMKSEIAGVSDTVQKEAVKMTKSMYDFGSQTASQLKESIGIQKQAIKDLQQQIKELQSQASNSTGKNKIAANSALTTAKRDLIAEQGALLAMQKALATGNYEEEKSQTSLIGSLGKWAVGLFSVVAAMKTAKEIMESTEGSSEALEKTINATTTAVQYLFRAIASGDWSNFWEGMERSVAGAIKLTEEMEKIERRQIQQSVLSAEAQKQITALRTGTFDKGVENTDKLIENLGRIIEIEKEDYAKQAVIAKDKYELTRNQMALDNKMSADKLESLTFEYTKNEQLIELAKRYSEISEKVGTGAKADYFQKTRPEKYKELTAEMASINAELNSAYGITAKEAVALADKFEKPTLKALKSLADLKQKQIELEGQSQIGSRRDENQLAAAINRKKTEQEQADKKAQELANQLSRKQIDYDTEVGRQRLANQIEIEQTLLNAKKDSAEKQRQQADIDFKRALLDIANQKESQLKKLNEANGGIDLKTGKKTASYVSVLPEEDQKQIDQKIIAAEKLKNATIDQINEKESEKIKEIWREVTDYRLTGIEKEKAAVKAHYDELEKAAKKAGDSAALSAIPKLRQNANDEIDRKYDLQQLDFLEKVEIQKNEIQAKGLDREAKLEKSNYESWVRIQKQKIEILKKSTDTKDQHAATLLENEIEIKTEERKSKIRQQILDYSREFTSELINQLGLTQDQNKELQGVADTVYNLAKGDYLSAGFSAASTLLTALFSGSGKPDATTKALERTNQLLSQQAAILANMSGSNYFVLAEKQYNEYGKAIDLSNTKLKEKGLLTEAQMEKLRNSMGYGNGDILQAAKDLVKNWSADDFVEAYTKGTYIFDQQQTEWVKTIVDAQKQRAELLQETFRQALGFDSSDIADTIVQGIQDGLELAADGSLGTFIKPFGEELKSVLVKNIKEALEMKLTDGFMTDFTSFLSANSAGGTALTPEELAKLEKEYASAVGESTAAMAALQPILAKYGLDITNSSSALTGISASVTEDTMSAFIGLMTAVRIDIKSIMVSIAAEAVDMGQLVGYAKRTAENSDHLPRLKAIEEGIANTNRILNDKLG